MNETITKNGYAIFYFTFPKPQIFPFSKLIFNRNKIILDAFLVGKYEFTPNQVVSMKKLTKNGFLGSSSVLEIKHNVKNYPKNIYFLDSVLNSKIDKIIEEISATGFIPKADPVSILKTDDSAVRMEVVVAVGFLWTALVLMDLVINLKNNHLLWRGYYELGISLRIAVVIIFLAIVSFFVLPASQNIIIKKGRNFGEARPGFVYFLIFIGIAVFIMLVEFVSDFFIEK